MLLFKQNLEAVKMLLVSTVFLMLVAPETALGQTDRVLPGELDELVFVHGDFAPRRRSPPLLQMQLVSVWCRTGVGCDESLYVHPSKIRCKNVGGTLTNPHWECSAALIEGLELYDIFISCEHYESSDDPYIYKHSCVAEYELSQLGTGDFEVVDLGGKFGIMAIRPVVSTSDHEHLEYSAENNAQITTTEMDCGSVMSALLLISFLFFVVIMINLYCTIQIYVRGYELVSNA